MRSTSSARRSPAPPPWSRNSASGCINSGNGRWTVTPGSAIFKYLVYPFFLERAVGRAARGTKFDLLVSQHAISAVAAGKLKRTLRVPVVMNFPDLLTGFMETWPAWLAPRPLVAALKRHELSLPTRYAVDGLLTVSDTLADIFAERGFPREKILPMYYGYDAEMFPFRAQPPPEVPPVAVMHGSFDAHHLGPIAFEAVKRVTQWRPGVVFRFVGKKTAVLESFLNRAEKWIPGFKAESTGFVPYAEVAGHLAGASVGIVPYEESSGTHCAFVAKIVEYVASGLPAVSTPLRSIRRYFQNDPMVRFSEFAGADFGEKIIGWLDESPAAWQIRAAESAARVQAELDWGPLCRRAVDFIEKAAARIPADARVP